MYLLAKRLERGRFVWPRTDGEAVTISAAQLGYLLEGIDWRLPQRAERPQADATWRLGRATVVARQRVVPTMAP
jgi:transposase